MYTGTITEIKATFFPFQIHSKTKLILHYHKVLTPYPSDDLFQVPFIQAIARILATNNFIEEFARD